MILSILLSLLLISNSIYLSGINVFAATSNCNTNTVNDPCVQANSSLKPCNFSIPKIPATQTSVEFLVSKANAAPCACNQAVYNVLAECAQCMTTSSLEVKIKCLAQYKADCTSFGTTFDVNAAVPPNICETSSGSGSNMILIIVFVTIAIVAVAVVASFVIYQLCKRKRQRNQNAAAAFSEVVLPQSHHTEYNNSYSNPQSNYGPPRYYN